MPVTRRGSRATARTGPLGRRRAWLTWRRPDDRGAVAVLFSVLLGGGVLLGMLALVVDVGQLYGERNQLQNGADAAALAIAKACSPTPAPDCASHEELVAIAQRFANANAADDAATVAEVCGYLSFGNALPACDPGGASAMCLGALPDQDYVEVRLSTRLPDGSTVLPPAFAQTLAGGGSQGTTVGACARAVWGPRPLTILAVTISSCEFNEATRGGTDYGSRSNPSISDEYVIQFWNQVHGTCTTQPTEPGWSQPGPAGILQGASASCRIGIDGAGIVNAATEPWERWEIAFEPCEDRMDAARWVSGARPGDVIYLPVHDGVRPGGSAYRVYQVAPFLVTAYQLGAPPSANPPYNPADHRVGSALPGSHYRTDPCGTPQVAYRCITGIFLDGPIPVEALTDTARIRLVG
jgi:hypothetical protein